MPTQRRGWTTTARAPTIQQLGQFTSADTVLDGLNRYGYVGGNPISRTDPPGQSEWAIDPGLIGGFAPASTGEAMGIGIGIAGFLQALSSATTTTPAAVPQAGTPDPAATFSVNGATINVAANGDLVVTTYGAGYASTTTSYTAGEAGWLTWSQAISAAYADTDYWNARTAPHATTSTSTSVTVSGVAPNWGSGGSAGSGAGMSNPVATGGGTTGGFPAGSGVQIPATTPPIGIAVGIDVGITSVDVGGTVALEWLLGALYAKKADLKQLRAAARQAGIKDEEDFREFGNWLEWDEKRNEGRGPNDHYSFKELVKLGMAGTLQIEERDGTSMSRWKSRTSMSFRLVGNLPPAEEVTRLLGVAPTVHRRKGEPIHLGRRQQPVDVWILDLIARSEWEDGPRFLRLPRAPPTRYDASHPAWPSSTGVLSTPSSGSVRSARRRWGALAFRPRSS